MPSTVDKSILFSPKNTQYRQKIFHWSGASANFTCFVSCFSGVFGSVCSASTTGSELLASSVSMVQITSPTSSVSSSSAKISLIVPLKDDGISAVTLSVKTSAIASYFSTVSPGLTNHELIVPSVTLSLIWAW